MNRDWVTRGGALLVMAACAGLATGCGGSSSLASHPGTSHNPAVSATHAASPSASPVAAVAGANERKLAYWLASTSQDASSLARIISGPVMRDYVKFEALLDEADAASGSPDTPGTVSMISAGYQDCGTDSSGSTTCDSFTGFRTNASGRITDFAVNGQRISPRLAVGASSTGSQLAVSDVVAYRLNSIGQVAITYKARNVTSHVVGNGNPAFLAVFDPSGGGQFQEDDSNSTLPGNLQPGESAVEYASFATRTGTGQFSLRTNDGYMAVLAASTLRMPRVPVADTAVKSPATRASATTFECKVLQINAGEEFSVSTIGGRTYAGTVDVSFSGPTGSGDVFPGTTVNGATPVGTWHQVPAADIGASAEPSACTASAG